MIVIPNVHEKDNSNEKEGEKYKRKKKWRKREKKNNSIVSNLLCYYLVIEWIKIMNRSKITLLIWKISKNLW